VVRALLVFLPVWFIGKAIDLMRAQRAGAPKAESKAVETDVPDPSVLPKKNRLSARH
jgi:hypothetical protein